MQPAFGQGHTSSNLWRFPALSDRRWIQRTPGTQGSFAQTVACRNLVQLCPTASTIADVPRQQTTSTSQSAVSPSIKINIDIIIDLLRLFNCHVIDASVVQAKWPSKERIKMSLIISCLLKISRRPLQRRQRQVATKTFLFAKPGTSLAGTR